MGDRNVGSVAMGGQQTQQPVAGAKTGVQPQAQTTEQVGDGQPSGEGNTPSLAESSTRDFLYNDLFNHPDSPLKGLPEQFKQSYSQNVGENFAQQLSPQQQNKHVMDQGMLGENKQVDNALKNAALTGLADTIRDNPGIVANNAGQFVKAGLATAADHAETALNNLAHDTRPKLEPLSGSSPLYTGPPNPLLRAGADMFGALRRYLSQ